MPRYADGNATRMAWTQLDHIEDLDESFDDFAAHKAYFEQYSPADLFRKGIDQRLLALQYDGSMEDTTFATFQATAQHRHRDIRQQGKVGAQAI